MAVVTEIFPNFASALAACGQGYNDGEIADVIAYKTALAIDPRQLAPEQAINSILAVGISAAETTARPLKVLDFGGGCGFHYFRVTPTIKAPLQWALVETPTMAERAAKVANGRFDVFTTIDKAHTALGHVDLVHASSVIQYVPNPLETLKSLAALRAPHFLLARLPVWGTAQIVGVQTSPLSANGIGPMPPHIADRPITYPVTFVNFDEVMRILADYEIAMSMPSPSSIYEIRGQRVPGISVIFRAKDSSRVSGYSPDATRDR
ncbi:MAG TPA: methyltransferase, TIGR04325 family [Xanthobacteraceae bacterium]|nr:methyltransferase, TIGR04325 family [Xanthobacteraceae bacterium]